MFTPNAEEYKYEEEEECKNKEKEEECKYDLIYEVLPTPIDRTHHNCMDSTHPCTPNRIYRRNPDYKPECDARLLYTPREHWYFVFNGQDENGIKFKQKIIKIDPLAKNYCASTLLQGQTLWIGSGGKGKLDGPGGTGSEINLDDQFNFSQIEIYYRDDIHCVEKFYGVEKYVSASALKFNLHLNSNKDDPGFFSIQGVNFNDPKYSILINNHFMYSDNGGQKYREISSIRDNIKIEFFNNDLHGYISVLLIKGWESDKTLNYMDKDKQFRARRYHTNPRIEV